MPFSRTCLDSLGLSFPVCRNRLRCISVGQKTESIQRVELVDGNGDPIDLTQYGVHAAPSSSSSSSSSCSLSSWSGHCHVPTGYPADFTGVEIVTRAMDNSACLHWAEIVEVRSEQDAKDGIVYLTVSCRQSQQVGIWLAMAIIWQCGAQVRHVPLYFAVNGSLREHNSGGPPNIWEIRYALRDLDPEANFLLDAVEFHDDEILVAARRCIDYWNETPPPLARHTSGDFPYRYNWIEGIIGELLRSGAMWMYRNALDYTVTGLSVSDTKKWPDYLKMGNERIAIWKDFVKNKKIELNLAAAYGSLGGWRTAPYR